MPQTIIAIDGTAGSGKGTLGRQLAQVLGLKYLDTGSLYRGVTFWTKLRKYDLTKPYHGVFIAKQLREITLEPHDWGCVRLTDAKLKLNAEEITSEIRRPCVNRLVSQVSCLAAVREWVNEIIYSYVGSDSAVVDGRDIGSVVYPKAPVKFWLTVDQNEAVRRQLQGEARVELSMGELAARVAARNKQDQNRALAPAVVAADAMCIDTTYKSRAEVAEIALAYIRHTTVHA